MVNGLGQNHLKWLQVRKFSKDHVYFVDLWITFIHSWGGLEFQLKVCVEERKEKIWWYARKKCHWGFFIMTAFSPTFPEKKSKYKIYFPKSFRQWKKQIFLVVENYFLQWTLLHEEEQICFWPNQNPRVLNYQVLLIC